jgi:hypothetical protein
MATHKYYRFVALGMLCFLALSLPGNAESADGDKWEFHIAPYVWLAGQKGDVATLPGLPATGVDVNFYDDILGNINFAGMLIGEARKGRVGVMADVIYTDIEDKAATPGPFFSGISSRTKSWIVTAAGLYRVVDRESAFLDVYGGIRYWSVDSTLQLKTGLLPGRRRSNTEDWVDPIIGLKGKTPPLGNSKFFLGGALTLGGLGVGSDLMWDAMINVGYQWTPGFSTTIGYRYLYVDYENKDFLYDVAQDGMVLGLSWRF